jgi:hypothetical protein
MKKLTNLLITACLPLALQAQPTINNMENYTTPYKINRANCDADNVAPGNPGGNQHWMFDNLTEQDTSAEWILPPSITPNSAFYPTANEVRVTVDGTDSTFVFYEKQNISLCLGSTDNTNSFMFHFRLPGILLAKRPIAYPDMLLHGYDIAHSSGGPKTGTGTGATQVDGWGMLHLPNGNHMNVIRVKTTIHQEDTIATTPTLITTVTDVTRYAWYSDTYKSPLLSWDSTHIDYGLTSVDTKELSYLVSEGDPASVKQAEIAQYRHHAYFSGASTLTLQSDIPQGRSYEMMVLSPAGLKIYSSEFTTAKLNTFNTGTELPTGMYLVRINEKGSGNSTTLKVMKQ